MYKPVIVPMFALALAFALPAAVAQDATASASDAEKVQQTMSKFSDDLQALEADAVAKSITLNAEEAAAFWPQFKAYQAEQRKIADGQVAAVRDYADKYQSLTDEQAVAYVTALLQRDEQINALRVKYLAAYTKTIGARRAARVIHLARKLGFASQAKFAEVIPLVH
jgi:hypothetical protein